MEFLASALPMWHATNDKCCRVLIKPVSKEHRKFISCSFQLLAMSDHRPSLLSLTCVYYTLQRVEVRFKKDDIHGKDVDIVGRMKDKDVPSSSERCPTPHEIEPSYY